MTSTMTRFSLWVASLRKRTILLFFVALALVSGFVGRALAAGPHFVGITYLVELSPQLWAYRTTWENEFGTFTVITVRFGMGLDEWKQEHAKNVAHAQSINPPEEEIGPDNDWN